jgi:hypothetical protein
MCRARRWSGRVTPNFDRGRRKGTIGLLHSCTYGAGLWDSHIGEFIRRRIDRSVPRSATPTSVRADTHEQTPHDHHLYRSF